MAEILYPAVAGAFELPPPSPNAVWECWGEPLAHTLPRLFGDPNSERLLLELRRQHQKSPPPPFEGVVRRLKSLTGEPNNQVVIFSAGDPDIVNNTITLALGLTPGQEITVYNLPPHRRLTAVDVDLISDHGTEEPDAIFVISDTPQDAAAVAGDPKAEFFGIFSSRGNTKDACLAAGIPMANLFENAALAIDEISQVRHSSATALNLSSLESAVRERRLLVFLGAGVSIDSGLPSGAGLAELMGDKSLPLDRLMTALSEDPKAYNQLHRKFASPNLRPNRIHRALALLDAPYYIGTNWDHLLEKAFKDLYGDSYDAQVGVAFIDSQLPSLVGKRNAYLKLHGDIDSRDSLVHSLPAYASRISKPTLVDKFVEVLINTSAVLFVGYSVSDINVLANLLEHTKWPGGSPPERFALLPAQQVNEKKLLENASITTIDVAATVSRSISERVFDVLARLYDARDDFASDVQLLTGIRKHSPTEVFYEALAFYQASDFKNCYEAIEEIRSKALDWRQESSLFARFCYLVVKVYDKLERWDDLTAIENFYITDHLKRAENVMPGTMFEWLRGHHASALALAALRAGEPQQALRYAEEAIIAARRQSRSARLLLADRRVVRAMVIQYLVQCGDRDRVDSAWDDLKYAGSALNRFGGLTFSNEPHFAGRYYGTTVFLHLASDVEKESLVHSQLDLAGYAARSHDATNRVPYGVLAGRYCHAYYNWKMGDADLPRSIDRLRDQLNSLSVGPSVSRKVDIFRRVVEQNGDGLPLREESGYARRHIEQLGIEGWLGTPIN